MKTSSTFYFIIRILFGVLIIVTSSSAAFSQTVESDSLYDKGITLFEQGKYKEAIEKFRQVWELDSVGVPKYMPAYETGKDWMAYAYQKMGNEKMAKHLNPACYDMRPDDRRKFGRINDLFQQYNDDIQNQMWLLAEIHLSSAVDEAEKIFGKESVIHIQSLVGLATLHLEREEYKKLSECINKLERIEESWSSESTYLSAYIHLLKGYTYLDKGKFAESLAEARKCREELKGLEDNAFYEYGKMVVLYGLLTYYGDPEIFESADKALEELKGVVDGNIDAYFSLPTHKQIDGADLIAYSLDVLLHYPKVISEDYDGEIARYIDILRAADRDEYPYTDNALSYALYCRAKINNESANFTGKGYDKVWVLAEEAIRLADASPIIEKKNCLELMMVGVNALIALQRFEEAEKIIDEVVAIAEDKSNDRQYYLIDAINGKTMLQQRKGRTDLAIETMRKYLGVVRSMKSQYPSETANLLMNYAGLISNDFRNIKEYVSVLKEVSACLEQLDYPELQPHYLNVLLLLASRNGTTEEEQREAFEKADAQIKKLKSNPMSTPENIAIQEVNILKAKALAAKSHNEYEMALEYISEAISIQEKSEMGMPSDLLNIRTEIYVDMYDMSGAMKSGEELMALNMSMYGPDDVNTIQAMSNMIDIYCGNLKYDKAREMVSGIEKTLDKSWQSLSPEFLTHTLIITGNFYIMIRDYDHALEVLEKAKRYVANKNLDSGLLALLDTAYLKAKSKTDKSAEVLAECKALVADIDQKGYTPDRKFQLLTELGGIAKELGEIGYALELFEKSYEEYEMSDDVFFWMNYLTSLSTYHDLLNQLGKADKARDVILKYSELLDKVKLNGVVMDMLSEVRTIMDLAFSGGEEEALGDLEKMHKKLSEEFGETSEVAQSLKKSIIEAHPTMGHSMQETFESGLPLLKKLREENKPALPGLLLTMLTIAQYVDQPEETDLILAEIEQIPAYRLSPLQRVNILSAKGTIALRRSDHAKGMELYRDAFEKSRSYVLDNFLSMSAEERESFWNGAHQFFRTQIPQAVLIANGLGGSGFEPLVYDCALFTNSLLLSSDMTIVEAAASSKDKKVKKAYQEYEMYKQQLAEAEKIYADGHAIAEDFEKQIENLRTTLRKSERNLLNMLSDKLGRYNSHLAISSGDVRKALGPNEAAIEFLEFPVTNNPQANQYIAAVLKSNEDVKLIPLFAVSPDSEDWLKCYDSENLFNMLWKPLEEHLQGVADIWFATQGKLSVTAIESLPGLETLDLGTPFTLHRLTSTRQLALNKEAGDKSRQKKNMEYVAYGGINYGAASEEMMQADRERRKSQKRGVRSVVSLRDVFGDNNRKVELGIEELPGTEREARYLADLVTRERKGTPTLLTGAKATEGSFKDYSGRTPVLIHIGTHGFYFDDAGHNSAISPEKMAMQHSGLLLAGAEKGLFEPETLQPDAEDGVLTASEISQLDFSGSDLIVMSACETGLGKISADGVFGLQRGFKKAGANAIMMSLWKVDDEATTRLMEEFYDGWLRKGLSKNEALQKAKETLRADSRWDNPRYWAAFILLDAMD